VHRLQLRAPRDQDLHVSAGVAVQVVERRRARGGLRSLLPAYSPDQSICEDEEEGGVPEQEQQHDDLREFLGVRIDRGEI
jgi:hypothetical protein